MHLANWCITTHASQIFISYIAMASLIWKMRMLHFVVHILFSAFATARKVRRQTQVSQIQLSQPPPPGVDGIEYRRSGLLWVVVWRLLHGHDPQLFNHVDPLSAFLFAQALWCHLMLTRLREKNFKMWLSQQLGNIAKSIQVAEGRISTFV